MWGFKKSEKMDILQKTQENLEATQKNTDMLVSAFKEHIESNNNQIIVTKDNNNENTEVMLKLCENLDSMQKNNLLMADSFSKHIEKIASKPSDVSVPVKTITKAEKIKAAYALNLCTVSVSQIIDYNDMQILESEYEAILNNLNLEHFPKDDALLEILKHLLDVITFFRIQEGDKKIMEEEYARRMKNAIWSAVPNIGMVVAGGSPVGIAVSLACQIGIGYMNYRKEKAKIGLEKQRSEWELQRSAIEQFNGLRRELFDTAWRLADEYDFPDKYRLTERQINQYNTILMDTDDMRRYERLQYISENFIAYPPFWYYLGHAANSIYVSRNYGNINYDYYKEKAIEYFDKFFSLTDEDLLRENQLVASCALEKFDLIDNKSEKIKLIEKAKKASGNAFDSLELCAISYLKINEIDKACDLLRMLVNEEYNVQINAQLLSRIYVQRSINEKDEQKRIEYHNDYMTLDSRVSGSKVLFPMLEGVTSIEIMEKRFIENRKEELRKSYGYALAVFIEKCEEEYLRIYRTPGNIVMAMAEYMSEIKESLKLLIGDVAEEIFLRGLNSFISNNGEEFQKSLMEPSDDYRTKIDYEEIFEAIFKRVANNVIANINSLTQMGNVTYMESNLYSFKKKQNILDKNEEIRKFELSAIEKILLGEKSNEKIEIMEKIDKCLSIMNDIDLNNIIKKENKYILIKKGDIGFEKYFDRKYVEKLINNAGDIIPSEDSIVAVLQKNAINVAAAVASNVTSIGQVYVDYRLISDADLVFTTEGIAVATNFSAGKNHCKYSDVYREDDKIIIDSYKYKQNDIDNKFLYRMIGKLKEVSYEVEKNLAARIRESVQTGCLIDTMSTDRYFDSLSEV